MGNKEEQLKEEIKEEIKSDIISGIINFVIIALLVLAGILFIGFVGGEIALSNLYDGLDTHTCKMEFWNAQ